MRHPVLQTLFTVTLCLSVATATAQDLSAPRTSAGAKTMEIQSDAYVNPFTQKTENLASKSSEISQNSPFGDTKSITSLAAPRCGSETTLGHAELRKADLAVALCERRYVNIDEEWLFILHYVTGFNEFLEERGSFMDPTGACARVAEPRHRLGLIYESIDYGIDYILGRNDPSSRDARLDKLFEPFLEDWRRIPFLFRELNIWSREGRLDATSIAARGMCSDPEFQLFWSRALEYAQRIPGTGQ